MNQYHKRGFTIIEVTLAMTFVATLLVAIALLTIQISHIYNKGITLTSVNTAGQSIGDDFNQTLGASTPVAVPLTTTSYIPTGNAGGGRFCTGTYTYAWNTGVALAGGAGAPPIYNVYTGDSKTSPKNPINLVRVNDPGGQLCVAPSKTASPSSETIDPSQATELLSTGDRNLAVQSLTFSAQQSASDTTLGQALYYIKLVIGTNDQAELIAGSSCKTPAAGDGTEDYCAVNEFDFVVRAGNKEGASS